MLICGVGEGMDHWKEWKSSQELLVELNVGFTQEVQELLVLVNIGFISNKWTDEHDSYIMELGHGQKMP